MLLFVKTFQIYDGSWTEQSLMADLRLTAKKLAARYQDLDDHGLSRLKRCQLSEGLRCITNGMFGISYCRDIDDERPHMVVLRLRLAFSGAF